MPKKLNVTTVAATTAQMNFQNYRAQRVAIDAELAEVEGDPGLTERQREKLAAPLREKLTKLRDLYAAANETLVKALRKQKLDAEPRAQVVREGSGDPVRAAAVRALAAAAPVRELHELAATLADDPAALYGLYAAVRERADIDARTQSELVTAIGAPYAAAYARARDALLVAQVELSRVKMEGEHGSRFALSAAHEAMELVNDDGSSTSVTTADVDAAYTSLGMSPTAA